MLCMCCRCVLRGLHGLATQGPKGECEMWTESREVSARVARTEHRRAWRKWNERSISRMKAHPTGVLFAWDSAQRGEAPLSCLRLLTRAACCACSLARLSMGQMADPSDHPPDANCPIQCSAPPRIEAGSPPPLCARAECADFLPSRVLSGESTTRASTMLARPVCFCA